MCRIFKFIAFSLVLLLIFSAGKDFAQTPVLTASDPSSAASQPASSPSGTVPSPAAPAHAAQEQGQTPVAAKKKKPKTLRESARKSMRSRDSVFLALSKGDTSAAAMLQHMQQYTATFNQINNNLAEGL